MTTPDDIISSVHEWFTKAVPEPTDKNKSVQLGVHFEEIGEMLTALLKLDIQDTQAEAILASALSAMNALAKMFKNNEVRIDWWMHPVIRKELLDSLLDQIVTSIGVSYMNGMDGPNGLDEVNRANWSKFDADGNPIFDENGKVKKGPDYDPPELDPYI